MKEPFVGISWQMLPKASLNIFHLVYALFPWTSSTHCFSGWGGDFFFFGFLYLVFSFILFSIFYLYFDVLIFLICFLYFLYGGLFFLLFVGYCLTTHLKIRNGRRWCCVNVRIRRVCLYILELMNGSNSGASIFKWPGVSYRCHGLRACQETRQGYTLYGVVMLLSFYLCS